MFTYQIHIFMLFVSSQKGVKKALGLKGATNSRSVGGFPVWMVFLFGVGTYLIIYHAGYT